MKRKTSRALSGRKAKPDGDALRANGLALPLGTLPEPQERWEQPTTPGKPETTSKLWFEGESKLIAKVRPPTVAEEEETEEAYWRTRRPHEPGTGARDVRSGDRWLPWHFAPGFGPNPIESRFRQEVKQRDDLMVAATLKALEARAEREAKS